MNNGLGTRNLEICFGKQKLDGVSIWYHVQKLTKPDTQSAISNGLNGKLTDASSI